MSSRFPIGVGQTTSRPRSGVRLPREQRRADHPRLVPERRRDDPHRVAPGRSARARISARAGSSSSSPAPITPPPITITSGFKTFTSEASPTPSARPTRGDHVARHGIAVVRQLGHERRRSARARPPARARAPCPAAAPPAARLAPERRARGHHLQAAAVRAVALQGGPSMSIDHVPELAARPDQPRCNFPPSTSPPPMPVPRVSITTSDAPAAAPKRVSASTASCRRCRPPPGAPAAPT